MKIEDNAKKSVISIKNIDEKTLFSFQISFISSQVLGPKQIPIQKVDLKWKPYDLKNHPI